METYDSLPEYQRKELHLIDKEIQDYLGYIGKLHQQTQKNLTFTHATISRKHKKRFEKFLIDKNSLPKYAQKKLADFQRRKDFLLRQKEFKKEIPWDSVRFDDYNIRFHLNGILSESFALTESRKSFEYLKSYIVKFQLEPIRAKIWGNKIISIENVDQIQRIIQILSIQDEINLYFSDFELTTVEKILSKLRNISNQHLLDLFKLRERGDYLNYLCEFQSPDYKIIPTTEVIKVNPRTDTIEETFLFTLARKNGVYVIWESTSINRATYIFQTARESYATDVQRVFDFIASSQPKKRRKLRNLIGKGKNPLKTIGVVEHDGLKQWRTRVTEKTK